MCNRRVSLLLACLSVSAFAVTERTLLDDGWRFHTGWEQGSRRFTFVFNGHLSVVVRAKPGTTGPIRVKVEAEGVQPVEVDVSAVKR